MRCSADGEAKQVARLLLGARDFPNASHSL
jgi:hypothetical protein